MASYPAIINLCDRAAVEVTSLQVKGSPSGILGRKVEDSR